MDGANSGETEFLFGGLSRPDGRAEHARVRQSGLRHDSRIDPRDPAPNQPTRVFVSAGPDVAARDLSVVFTTDGTPPLASSPTSRRVPCARTGTTWSTPVWGYVEEWSATLPGQPSGTLVRYAIVATLQSGRTRACADGAPVPIDRARHHAYHVDDDAPPAWLREAVIYQVFVDRFAPEPGREFDRDAGLARPMGGTLRGLIARLDSLAEFGIDVLWLTPIHPSPSYHGYDPTDLRGVEPRLGTLDDWSALVDAAHRRGIRILLDFVANHTSDRDPLFRAAQGDRADLHVPWFRFSRWPDRYDGFFALTSMPTWNTQHPDVRRHLIESAMVWLERGCDGFRLDHAQGPGPSFWAEFRARVRARFPSAALVGEVTEPPDSQVVYEGRLDGVLDFTLADAIRSTFARDTMTPSRFLAFLVRQRAFASPRLVLPGFLDNHDMNRFMWLCKGDVHRLKLAALCLFTLPGPPILYYGTEVGLSQERGVGPLEETRLPMRWEAGRDEALRQFFRDLIAIRRTGAAAWRSGPTPVVVDDDRGLLGYRAGAYLIVLNNSARDTEVTLRQADTPHLLLSTHGAAVHWDGRESLHLPPRGGAILA